MKKDMKKKLISDIFENPPVLYMKAIPIMNIAIVKKR